MEKVSFFLSVLLCICEAKGVEYSGPGMTDGFKLDARQFINTVNATERDFHQYYNSTFYGKNTPTAQNIWFELSTLSAVDGVETIEESAISDSFRVFDSHPLHFDFQFYGHYVNLVQVTTAGFLYTSDYIHSRIHLTQYIAPLQADFNPSLSSNAKIFIYSSVDRFTVQWDRVRLNSNISFGDFTFQVSLFPNGTIHFAYRDIPTTLNAVYEATLGSGHPVEVGLADSYYIDMPIQPNLILRQVFEYSRIRLSATQFLQNSAYILEPVPGCVTPDSCESCVAATEATIFTCGWCNSLSRCSDGFDRFRQEWLDAGCETTSTLSCSALSSGAVAGIAVGVVLPVVLLLLITCVGVGVCCYGYKNPTSSIGLFMIEHRPKAKSLNKDSSASYKVDSGKATLGEA